MAELLLAGTQENETDYSQSDIQITNRGILERKFVLLMFGKESTDFLVCSALPL